QLDRSPGLSDYLTGQCTFSQALRRLEGMNLYLLPAGSPVKNPLELLNMRQAKALFEELPRAFNWAIFDTPPLLFSADANLLATLADGTILVVKIGSTTSPARCSPCAKTTCSASSPTARALPSCTASTPITIRSPKRSLQPGAAA